MARPEGLEPSTPGLEGALSANHGLLHTVIAARIEGRQPRQTYATFRALRRPTERDLITEHSTDRSDRKIWSRHDVKRQGLPLAERFRNRGLRTR